MNRSTAQASLGAAMFTTLLLLAGCGRKPAAASLSGTWGSPDGQQAVTFHRDGTVLLHVGGVDVATRYTVVDDHVDITPPQGAPGGNLHLKIDADGCLHGFTAGMDPGRKICKKQ